MNKAEALKHAKRGVRLLRKNAIGFAKKHGDSRRHHARSMSTASIKIGRELRRRGLEGM